MSATDDGPDLPSEATRVAHRYLRVERVLSGVVALLVGLVAVSALLWLPLRWGLVAALATLALVRVPVFRSGGTTRLVTDADPGAVRAEFEGPAPPTIPFQWGVADGVDRTADGWVYEISYLFGLRSVRMETEVRSQSGAEGGVGADRSERPVDALELVVTAGDRPWGTYAVTLGERDDETVVDVAWESGRRFGLRRLPQWLVARRYRAAALSAQGYRVAERDAGLSL